MQDYTIHLDPEGGTLIGLAEIESEERWAAIATTEVCQRWWKHMADFMPTNPDNRPISRDLPRCISTLVAVAPQINCEK